MGFPQKAAEGPTAVAFVGADCAMQSGGFTCPRCKARVLDLPSTCHVCGLTLVSSSQLARSYHHLFPVKPYTEVSSSQVAQLVRATIVQMCAVSTDNTMFSATLAFCRSLMPAELCNHELMTHSIDYKRY